MKQELIQHRVISIPQTTAPQVYSTLIKADDCYAYLTGVATLSTTAPTASDFKIELRDDFKSVLSFSPYNNWLKNTTSASFNLQDCFKPFNIEARGRNFYLNVKVANCSAFDFVALLRQNVNPIVCARYDEQCWDIAAPLLGSGYEITLPSDYSRCKGIMVTGGDTANAQFIGLDIYDSGGAIVDPIPFAMLTPSINTPYDDGFFPVDFESKSRQIKVRLTALGTLPQTYTATPYTITFLLV